MRYRTVFNLLFLFAVCSFVHGQTNDPLYRAGEVKYKAKDYAGAVDDFTREIQFNPTNALAYVNRGLIRGILRQYDGALADLDKSVEMRPKNALILDNRAGLRFEVNDCAGALADLDKAISLHPDFGHFYTLRGTVKRALQDYDGAKNDYNKAIQLAPKLSSAYAGMGNVLDDLGHRQAALENYHTALRLNPALKVVAVQIWFARARSGEREDATRELAKNLEFHSDAAGADEWGATILSYLSGKMTDDAFLRAAKAAAVDARQEKQRLCTADYVIAMNHLLAGDKVLAIDFFQRSIATGEKADLFYPSAQVELNALKK